MTDQHSEEILGAEERRCHAMLRRDSAVLESLLDARLIFSHATGHADNKSDYLAKFNEGRILYKTIEWPEKATISLGNDHALLAGRMTVEVLVDGIEKRLQNRVLAAWARSDHAWRLVAFQSTPIK